ncbi:MAG TPA: energy transducer TonB [Candidatus Krumholzibacteria bacterium]|nr:energy transducer TonB [Candidatus Krumholzibacteria bacterium]
MSDKFLTLEFGTIQRNTRRSLGLSAAVHAALFLLLVFSHRAASESAGLTEITWVDAATLAAEEAAPPVAREETKSALVEEVKMQASRKAETPERFERPLERAEVAPRPQSRAVADILSEKIDAMERDGSAERTKIASLVQPPRVGVPTLAGTRSPDARPSGNPSTLARGTTPSGGPPAALQRTERSAGVPVAAVAVPTPPAGKTSPSAPATSTSTKNLAGAQLVGPVADRPLVSYEVPRYPDWAKRDGVEGSVTLHFFVLPDGRVKENILVERTSGFSDFDTGAIDALRQWKFQAIPGSGEQWGRITFNYRLSDTQ